MVWFAELKKHEPILQKFQQIFCLLPWKDSKMYSFSTARDGVGLHSLLQLIFFIIPKTPIPIALCQLSNQLKE